MPTLSLAGSLVSLCFCLAILLQPAVGFAGNKAEKEKIEKKNRIENIFSFGEVVLSNSPLPDKVFEQRRYTIQTYVVIHEKGDPKKTHAMAGGSGVAYHSNRQGIIISSAHVVQQLFHEFAKSVKTGQVSKHSVGDSTVTSGIQQQSEIHIFGQDELQTSKLSFQDLKKQLTDLNFEYKIYGRVYGRNTVTEMVPLKLVAITDPQSPIDLMALQVENTQDIFQKSMRPIDTFEAVNPYKAFLIPVGTATAQVGEKVYLCGFGGMQPYVEEGFVSAQPKDKENTQSTFRGLDEPYVLRAMPDFGFSGGPVLNSEGKLLGITKGGTRNFTLAISVKDIDSFIEKAKLKK